MVRLARILRDHAEAGAVNSLIALWAFVDEHTFLTKAGHVGVVYQMRGVDAEGLTQARAQLLSGVVEQLLIDSKRARDTEAATMNMQLVTWRITWR